jgi:cytochrome c-type biogenesis protein CcmE
VDLTPRTSTGEPTAEPARRSGRRRRRVIPVLVLTVVVALGGFMVTRFLASAIDYYCNVDEIGVRPGCDDERRLRIQGNVVEGSVRADVAATTFDLAFNGSVLPVRYAGQPGGIFQECIPVIVHGRFDGGTFQGDRVEVRHSNEYAEDHGDRIDEARSAACIMADANAGANAGSTS